MIDEQRIVEEFLELVQIDSVSLEEGQLCKVLKAKLTDLGLEVKEDDAGKVVGGQCGNIIATLIGNSQGPKILFSAHMDTVTPGKGVKPKVENGVISSNGETILGGDDKAGITVILEMLKVIKENKISHTDIQVLFTIGEEIGLLGAKNVDNYMLNSDIAYVLDSGGKAGTIIVQGPTQVKIDAHIKGKAAHAGLCPEEGVSAIQVAAEAIRRMKLGRIDKETTANIGVINGGKATNIVPDNVTIQGEARSLDPNKLAAQVQNMVQAYESAAKDFGAGVKVDVENCYPEINLSPDELVVQIAKKAAEKLGLEVNLTTTGGGSDANILNGYQIPTANLGVGMEKVHTLDEFIKIEDLVKSSNFLVEIVKEATLG